MFNKFLEFFDAANKSYSKESEDIYLDFIMNYSKESFGSGLFRVVDFNNLDYFKKLVKNCFNELPDDIRVIGFDWLGRMFVSSSVADEKIYMCDAGSHEILEIPLGIEKFLNDEVPEYTDELFALNFYKIYISQVGILPSYSQCIGYRQPLFLGGADDISNIEVIDLDVYWNIMSQI